jgi:hypothetical protein
MTYAVFPLIRFVWAHRDFGCLLERLAGFPGVFGRWPGSAAWARFAGAALRLGCVFNGLAGFCAWRTAWLWAHRSGFVLVGGLALLGFAGVVWVGHCN